VSVLFAPGAASVTDEPVRIEKHEDLSPILIFPATYGFFLAHGRVGHEALGLYIHLISTAERQHNNRVWADDVYLRKGLGIGQKKLLTLKRFLHDHKLISYHQERDEVTGRYKSREQGGKKFIRVLYMSSKAEGAVDGNNCRVGENCRERQETGVADTRCSGSENQVLRPTRKGSTYQERNNAVADSVIDYLVEKSGRTFQHTDSHRRLILARLGEGHSPEDLKLVVEHKVEEWAGTKMSTYLRPSTLFQAAKFDGYLADAREYSAGEPSAYREMEA
jgi:uncharacterized phage protein (TIGR02220 family)